MVGRSDSATHHAPRLGEVVEAATFELVAECYELHAAPPLGSLVRVRDGDTAIYAVTSSARTGSLDAGRRPIARGQHEATEEDVYRNNPELPELLRTEFTAAVVGFRLGGAVQQYLPPRPPRMHSFVYACPPAEVREFAARLDFLAHLVAAGQRGSIDELVAACLRQMGHAHDDRGADRAFLVRAGKELAKLYGADLNRLSAILRRIRG